MKGIPYWHPSLYRLAMKIIRKKTYIKKYQYLKEEIGERTTLDIGCGDCELARYIKKENYEGWDINQPFVKEAQKRGLNVFLKDVMKEKIPKKECILFSEVLHHLQPEYKKIVKEAVEKADKVIIIEPTKHLATSKNKILADIGKKCNNAGQKEKIIQPISKEELKELEREMEGKGKEMGDLYIIVIENEK